MYSNVFPEIMNSLLTKCQLRLRFEFRWDADFPFEFQIYGNDRHGIETDYAVYIDRSTRGLSMSLDLLNNYTGQTVRGIRSLEALAKFLSAVYPLQSDPPQVHQFG